MSGRARLFECRDIAPYAAGLERDRFVAVAIEDSVTELAAKKAQRLPQRTAGVRGVEVRPEQRNDGVPTSTVVRVQGKIGEEGEALGLSQDRMDRVSIG